MDPHGRTTAISLSDMQTMINKYMNVKSLAASVKEKC